MQNKLLIMITAVGIVSCTRSPNYCGESFCISNVVARSVIKRTPVEDFNTYSFSRIGRQYFVYEGDNPIRKPNLLKTGSLMDGRKFQLLRDESYAQLIVRIHQRKWPTYLSISTECSSNSGCGLVDLAEHHISIRK